MTGLVSELCLLDTRCTGQSISVLQRPSFLSGAAQVCKWACPACIHRWVLLWVCSANSTTLYRPQSRSICPLAAFYSGPHTQVTINALPLLGLPVCTLLSFTGEIGAPSTPRSRSFASQNGMPSGRYAAEASKRRIQEAVPSCSDSNLQASRPQLQLNSGQHTAEGDPESLRQLSGSSDGDAVSALAQKEEARCLWLQVDKPMAGTDRSAAGTASAPNASDSLSLTSACTSAQILGKPCGCSCNQSECQHLPRRALGLEATLDTCFVAPLHAHAPCSPSKPMRYDLQESAQGPPTADLSAFHPKSGAQQPHAVQISKSAEAEVTHALRQVSAGAGIHAERHQQGSQCSLAHWSRQEPADRNSFIHSDGNMLSSPHEMTNSHPNFTALQPAAADEAGGQPSVAAAQTSSDTDSSSQRLIAECLSMQHGNAAASQMRRGCTTTCISRSSLPNVHHCVRVYSQANSSSSTSDTDAPLVNVPRQMSSTANVRNLILPITMPTSLSQQGARDDGAMGSKGKGIDRAAFLQEHGDAIKRLLASLVSRKKLVKAVLHLLHIR